MPKLTPLSRTRHAQERWLRPTDYAYAAREAMVPLVARELLRAALSLTIGFVDAGGRYLPVALLALKEGENLYVGANGKWQGDYVPAAYRGYPFALVRSSEDKLILCMDEDRPLPPDGEGEPLFDATGEAAPAVGEVLDFLRQVEMNRQQTQAICALLQARQLFVPWPIRLPQQAGAESGTQQIEGLYQIDEKALLALSAEDFDPLRQAGALPLIYAHLLSTQHLKGLVQRARARAQAAAPSPSLLRHPKGELDLSFLEGNELLRFEPLS